MLWRRFVLASLFSAAYASTELRSLRDKRQVVVKSLYKDTDPMLQLGSDNFNSTVLNADKATMVEFYMSWCGHCRAFAPVFVRFCEDVKPWREVVQIAAINCALEENSDVCTANEVNFVPYIKYFPRRSQSFANGVHLSAPHSVSELRQQLTRTVLSEAGAQDYADWPRFAPPSPSLNVTELWAGVPPATEFLALILEDSTNSTLGAEMQLDLWPQRSWIASRRADAAHPMAAALHIVDFPTLTVFNRNVPEGPVYISELRRLFMADIEKLRPDGVAAVGPPRPNDAFTTPSPTTPFNRPPVEPVNYLSETDILLAIRYAMFTEVGSGDALIRGEDLQNLRNFTSVLARYWPITERAKGSLRYLSYPFPPVLDRSRRARDVFQGLSLFLNSVPAPQGLPASQWQDEFRRLETAAGRPFPDGSSSWVTCRGSQPSMRGYTCGLWSAFHALTASTYLSEAQGQGFNRFEVPYAIAGWVKSFFSCQECKTHFTTMTNATGYLPMWKCVEYPSDVVLFFWKAHNRVNARLAGDHTEDPVFPKVAWPPRELCPQCGTPQQLTPNQKKDRDTPARLAFASDPCGVEASWNTKEVMKFLLRFYSNIVPHNPTTSASISALA